MAFDIALANPGSAFNISFGIAIHYRGLFFSSPSPESGFISVTDGVKPQFICPNCHYHWQGLKQSISDINELVIFSCPSCAKTIGIYIKTETVGLTTQRSDGLGTGGIQNGGTGE